MYIPPFVKEGTRGKMITHSGIYGVKEYLFEVTLVFKTPPGVKRIDLYKFKFDEPNYYCDDRGRIGTGNRREQVDTATVTKRKSGLYMFLRLSRLYAKDKIEFYPDTPIKI